METILLMFSGGLDSTYLLFHYLTETDLPLHVHHISLRYPHLQRWKMEDPAVEKILAYCRTHYRAFNYSQSRFDMECLRLVGRDADLQLLVASKVGPNLPGERVTVVLGQCIEDIQTPEAQERIRQRVLPNLWTALRKSITGGDKLNPEISRPLIDEKIAKSEICRRMPRELLQLCWSCRRPSFLGGEGQPCGQCPACQKNIKMLAGLGSVTEFPNLAPPILVQEGKGMSSQPSMSPSTSNAEISGPFFGRNSETRDRSQSKHLLYPYTHKNRIAFGHGDQRFNPRMSSSDRFWIDYGRCEREVYDWRTECVIAAREIYEAYDGRELYLCLSGGIDSEVMVRSFAAAGVPFRIVITRYSEDINLHDIAWAVTFCQSHELSYDIFDLDIKNFWESGELYRFAASAKSVSPQIATLLKIMDGIHEKGGVPVVGCGEIYAAFENGSWFMHGREKYYNLYQYLIDRSKPGVARFFQWSPEIIYSYLQDSVLKKIFTKPMPPNFSTFDIKPEIYEKHWPLQRRPKYTGYEKIRHLDIKHRRELFRRYPHSDATVKTEISELLRGLAPITGKMPNVKTAGFMP